MITDQIDDIETYDNLPSDELVVQDVHPDVHKESDQQSLSELVSIFTARRDHLAKVCKEQAVDLESRYCAAVLHTWQGDWCARYKARWPDKSWEGVLAMADVLEKRGLGMLWCKVCCVTLATSVISPQVPKAASESWTSIFVRQWFGKKSRLLMWKQQVKLDTRTDQA